MTTREHLIASLAAALLHNAGWQPAHLISDPARLAGCPSGSTLAAHHRRLIARAAVALADDLLAEMADRPVLKLARPETGAGDVLIDLSADADDCGNR